MEWNISIEGDAEVLEFLSSVDSPDWKFIVDGSDYQLHSSRFEEIEDARDVRGAAAELAVILSGIAALNFGRKSALSVVRVARPQPDGPAHQYIFPEGISIEVGSGAPSLSKEFVARAARIALDDEFVRLALQLYGQGDRTWTNRYRVFEVMQASGDDLTRWASKSEVTRFSRTANHPSASGLQARHGFQSAAPPPTPMTNRDARLLIERLLYRWIVHRTGE